MIVRNTCSYIARDILWRCRFPREPSKIETNNVNPENDRIMGIPNGDCDDGEVDVKKECFLMAYSIIPPSSWTLALISILKVLNIP